VTVRERLDRVWPSLLALLGTVAVVVALVVLFGREVTPSATDGTGTAGDASAAPTGSATPSAEPSDGATTDPPATPEPPARAPVVVLNQTRVGGLAAETADALRAGGWEVLETGDFSSGVPQTTVYFPPGLEDVAATLDAEWDGIDRVMPIFSGLRDDVLTVILAETEEPPTPAGG
jgi:hypothetical protein